MSNPVVAVAKQKATPKNEVQILSTGYRAKIVPVSLSILNDVQLAIEYPEVPVVEIPEKGRSEPNPNDPTYIKQCEEVDAKRNLAAADAMVMFGIELLDDDGMPYSYPDDMRWLKKIKYFAKRGMLNLSEYDLEDEFDLEFLFKKYVAVGAGDIVTVGKVTGVNEEAVQEAQAAFQNNS